MDEGDAGSWGTTGYCEPLYPLSHSTGLSAAGKDLARLRSTLGEVGNEKRKCQDLPPFPFGLLVFYNSPGNLNEFFPGSSENQGKKHEGRLS